MNAPFPVVPAGEPLQQLVLVGIIAVAVSFYMGQWLPSEVVSLGVLALLGLASVLLGGHGCRFLSVEELLGGFSNPATITVGAMFVLSSGLMKTGALEVVGLRLAELSRGSPRRLLLMLALVVPPASAFVNNTPIVVLMVPVVLSVCREFEIKPSKLMIPLSFLAILGGTCTLLGTSTNILVDDLYRSYTLARRAAGVESLGSFPLRPGFGIFEFTPMGGAYLLVGVTFLILFSQRLLPERSSLSALVKSAERKAAFVTEVIIPPDSPWISRTVASVFESSAVRLLELVRGEHILLPAQAAALKLEPEDALILEGAPSEINVFLNASGADLASVVEDDTRVPMKTIELMLAEAVVLPDSAFEGRVVSELGLNRLYGVKVMAVQRHGRQHRYRIRGMRLHAGDVLLVQADATGLNALRATEAVLVVEDVDRTLLKTRMAPVALGILAAVIALATVTPVPIVAAALIGVALMLLTRCLRVDEALRSLDGTVLLLLAAAIPLGRALQTTGLAQDVVDGVVAIFGPGNPVVFLSFFYLLTSLLTACLSNNAVAALLVPIALPLAEKLQVNHEALLMAICFGASASFATPIGYQTNVIVMGPGAYTFRDYLRIGVPMTILMWIAATVLIPVFWPLTG